MAYHPEVQHAIAEMVIELESIGPHLDPSLKIGRTALIMAPNGPENLCGEISGCRRLVAGCRSSASKLSGGHGIFRSVGYERLFRDARLGRIHPANTFLTREVVAKTALGISLDEQPRWG